MSKLPSAVQKKIKEKIYEEADKHGYLQKSRPENTVFMNNLIGNAAIGEVLKEYMPKERVRTYIKDGVLNRYAKDRTALKGSIDSIIGKHLNGVFSIFVDEGINGPWVLLSKDEIVISAKGTFLKWETALRKILLCQTTYEQRIEKEKVGRVTRKILILNNNGCRTTRVDEAVVSDSLKSISVEIIWTA